MSLVCREIITVCIKLILLHWRINHASLRSVKWTENSARICAGWCQSLITSTSFCFIASPPLFLLLLFLSGFPHPDEWQLLAHTDVFLSHHAHGATHSGSQWRRLFAVFLEHPESNVITNSNQFNAGGVSWSTAAAKSPDYFSLFSTPKPRAASEEGLFDRRSAPSRSCIQDTMSGQPTIHCSFRAAGHHYSTSAWPEWQRHVWQKYALT